MTVVPPNPTGERPGGLRTPTGVARRAKALLRGPRRRRVGASTRRRRCRLAGGRCAPRAITS